MTRALLACTISLGTISYFCFTLIHELTLLLLQHKTRFGTRFSDGLLGYTRVNWYVYWALTLHWYELEPNIARVCTNKARINSVKQGLSRFDHDLHMIYIRLFHGSEYGLVRSCTIKHDFYSIYPTLTGFTFCAADLPYVHTCGVDFVYGCVDGLIRSHTFSHSLVRLLIRPFTAMTSVPGF